MSRLTPYGESAVRYGQSVLAFLMTELANRVGGATMASLAAARGRDSHPRGMDRDRAEPIAGHDRRAIQAAHPATAEGGAACRDGWRRAAPETFCATERSRTSAPRSVGRPHCSPTSTTAPLRTAQVAPPGRRGQLRRPVRPPPAHSVARDERLQRERREVATHVGEWIVRPRDAHQLCHVAGGGRDDHRGAESRTRPGVPSRPTLHRPGPTADAAESSSPSMARARWQRVRWCHASRRRPRARHRRRLADPFHAMSRSGREESSTSTLGSMPPPTFAARATVFDVS